ncbi:sensor histidine kinase [Ralstonia soli]|uniref:histidine kinase n=1 Tax=Ralstonia soli TaxID=2953896 RepID=A0ABT1AGN8_9RALS|nr:ATP-binding protein [Ralstonia soli]MCO5397560.1 ATP-binding protein [Ralstonia soli]
MKISTRVLMLSAWLVLSLAGTALIVSRSVSEAYNRFFQDSSIAIRQLSQKAAQHEAILATLGATPLSAPPADMLDSLRERMPQVTAIAFWKPGAGWQGEGGVMPTAALAHANNGKFALQFDGAQAYWLVAESGWAVRVEPARMLDAGDWPDSISSSALRLRDHTFALLQRPDFNTQPGWTFRLEKHLPVLPQAFVLDTTRTLTLTDLPWLPIALWNAVAVLIALGASSIWRLREVHRREHTRARIDRFGRLDTFGEMAAGLAHELNQPLTAIITHTRAAERMLDMPTERDSVRRALQTGVAQAKRAAAILDRLRTAVTSTQAGKRSSLDTDALMGTLLFLFRDELARDNIHLVWNNTAPRAQPLGEQVAVEQILYNLIRNARDALAATSRNGARGEIRVNGGCIGRRYRFSVVDNGPGVPADALPRLFEPFFTTRSGGLGLGLPLCETLAQRLEGTLTLQNLPTGGAEAVLMLPLAEEPA